MEKDHIKVAFRRFSFAPWILFLEQANLIEDGARPLAYVTFSLWNH